MTTLPTAQDVLAFWFEEISPASWWSAQADFDELVRRRFEPLLACAAAGECVDWRGTPSGRLAEIVVLDQFSRNIYRGTARAFAQDPMALVLAQEAVAWDALASLTPVQRSFMLLPYMHSESRLIHRLAEALYREHAPDENYQFELRHKAIIDRFGRYPHRNEVLGRVSTPQEQDFLTQPGSSF